MIHLFCRQNDLFLSLEQIYNKTDLNISSVDIINCVNILMG